jgi:serine/threonine protein kinase
VVSNGPGPAALQRLVNLNVKPDHFLVNSQGEVKINDFNTSLIVYDSTGESFLVPTSMGTTSYFSPEQFDDRLGSMNNAG